MNIVTTIDQDTIDQYRDGRDLLSETLTQRRQLLQKLEQMARLPQSSLSTETVAEFPLVRAQSLLFELCLIGDYIDMLIVEINSYAERCGHPKVDLINPVLQ